MTPGVLTLLERYEAHATFFVLGRRASSHPDLLRAAARNGNEIANHTYDHVDPDRIDPGRLATEIRRTASAITQAGVVQARFFRPPKGLFDDPAAEVVRDLGYRTVGWTLTLDKFVRQHGPRAGVRALLDRMGPGSIILAHDGPGRAATLEPLRYLLEELGSAGYRVVTVGRLLQVT